MKKIILEVITKTLGVLHSKLAFGYADNYRLLLRDYKAQLSQHGITMDDINGIIGSMQKTVTRDPHFSLFEKRPELSKETYYILVQPTIDMLDKIAVPLGSTVQVDSTHTLAQY